MSLISPLCFVCVELGPAFWGRWSINAHTEHTDAFTILMIIAMDTFQIIFFDICALRICIER